MSARRSFLHKFLGLCAATAFSPGVLTAMPDPLALQSSEGENFAFLFQGDSITDGNRTRDNDWNHVMGHGYAYLIASRLWFEFPKKKFHFFNRGISGNKITDLAARWDQDTLKLRPNLLSILIGINDVSAFINGDEKYSAEEYEKGYRVLLEGTKQSLPDIQFVLCEPFVLPGARVNEKWDAYAREVAKRRTIVKKLSIEYNAIFVEFQKAFNNALAIAPVNYWIWDGVHPMPAGHELMAREWIKQVSKKLKFIKYELR